MNNLMMYLSGMQNSVNPSQFYYFWQPEFQQQISLSSNHISTIPTQIKPLNSFPMVPRTNQEPVELAVNSLPLKKQKRKRQKNVEKEIVSAKKNSESNIINQFFSFFGVREKSQNVVYEAIKFLQKGRENDHNILNAFYKMIRTIKLRRGRRYINRMILLNFFSPESIMRYFPDIQTSVIDIQILTLNDLCQIFRRCCQKFLRTTCLSFLLTSKRMSSISKHEHLKKRRKIIKAIYSS